MNKKLICLTLSILMLLTCVFTGCSSSKNDESGESTVDNSAKTITMWLIAGDPYVEIREGETAEEAAARAKEEQAKAHAAVSKAFSEITKAKFKTNVELRFCSEEEYYAKMEAAIKGTQADIEMAEKAAKELRQYIKANKESGKSRAELTDEFYELNPQYQKYREDEADDEDAPVTEEETIKNEYGINEIKYPEAGENQVDIFYIGDTVDAKGNRISGYDKYMEYYNAEWLSSLSEELSTSSKKLTDYISTSLLNGVQIEGGVYAIPNNVPIGEYTYMFIDKELFDKYYHKIDNVKNVLDLDIFLNDIKNENAGKTPDDEGYIVPLESTFEECIRMLCWYWDLSYTDQSVYEMYYDEETGRNYVLKGEYEIEIAGKPAEDGSEGKPEIKIMLTNLVQADVLYKTNEEGKFVDKDGNVLNYSFRTDSEGYWLQQSGGKKPKYVNSSLGSMYLVDENGDAVTAENDRRVILTAEEDGIETKMDDYGNVKPTYTYSFDPNAEFSILGTMMLDPALRTRGGINLGFESLFTKRSEGANYHELYATLKDYDYQGFYGTPDESKGQQSAVFFQKGDAKILQDYNRVMKDIAAGKKDENGNDIKGYEWNGKTYYVVVAEYPEATESELYGNMYAVYANSPNLSRAMKVITYLNTNTELRNLLQYGIREYHYDLNDDGTVHLLSGNAEYGTYRMDIRRTGNCFIATPEESDGIDAWKYAKLQNNDSLINPLLGFDFNTATADSDYSLDILLIDHIKELNAKALEMIDECTTKEELMSLMSDSEDGFVAMFSSSAADKKLNKATNSAYDPSMPLGPEATEQEPDPDGSSPYAVYYTWLTTYGYLATTKTGS